MAVVWRYLFDEYPESFQALQDVSVSAMWSIITLAVGVLIAFRTNRAYSRFWEGITLVPMMRAEWFEACSNLMAFSKVAIDKKPADKIVYCKVITFQGILVRLMSLMHGAALRQIG